MSQFVEIDGSFLEGGGQILRIALSLSCILRRPVRISKIRANRPTPGLSNQHLFGLKLLQEVTGAHVSGDHIKSTEVEFSPGAIRSGSYKVDTRTAASVALVLQAALPVLLFGDCKTVLELIGGTNVGMAPQVDFMTEVLRPNMELFGASFDFDLLRRGYYPRGGGRCEVTVPPVKRLQPVEVTEFGALAEVCGWCFAAGRVPMRVAEDMKQAVCGELLKWVPVQQLQIEAYKESDDMARDNASGLILKAVSSTGCTLGASALSDKKRNVDANAVACELAEYLHAGICVDQYVQDQLIIFMTLASGISRIRTGALTNHTRTAMHVAELMTGVKFQMEPQTAAAGQKQMIISCEGIGHSNLTLK